MKQHTKRYMLIFKTISGKEHCNPYVHTPYMEHNTYSEEEFDDIKEVNATITEYTELYKNEVAPIYIESHYVNKFNGTIKKNLTTETWYNKKPDNPEEWKFIKEFWDFSDGRKWWGFIVLDFLEERIIKIGGDTQVLFCNKRKTGNPWQDKYIKKINLKTDLGKRDFYFRGDDEIPEDYDWDGDEEYEGWLQYRWGNGKNALTYVEPPKKKKVEIESSEASDEDLAKYLSNYTPTDSSEDDDSSILYDTNDDTNDDTINDPNSLSYEDLEEQFIAEDNHKFKDNDPWY